MEENKHDFTCEYAKHYCELRQEKLGKRTSSGKIRDFFKNITVISQSNVRVYWYLKSTGAIQLEMIQQKESGEWFIVHPFSQLRWFWEILMTLVLFVSLTFVPFKSGFLNPLVARYYLETGKSVESIRIALIIDFVLDLIWMTDTFANFVTGYYDWCARKTVMDSKTIAKSYMKGAFYLDVTCCLPVESVYMFCWGIKALSKINQIAFIFLQIYIVYSTARFRRYIRLCRRIGRSGNFQNLTIRLLFSVIVYFWIINWSIYLSLVVPQMIYSIDIFNTSNKHTFSWAQEMKLYEKDLSDQYQTALLKSLYTNIGVSTWDNMFAVDDYIMAVIICIAGRIYWIAFLVWFLEVVTATQALRVKFLLILEHLKTYMKQKEVPLFLKKRLSRFYFYRIQAHYFRDRAILAKLTDSLRKEISMYTCQKLIHNTEVFQSVPRKVVQRLVQQMSREMYFPNDVIIRANTFGECMYFICSGTVAVWTASDKEICRLEDGEFFGEIALIDEDRRRTATVTAVTITEVYRLEATDYKKIIQLYPDVFTRLEKFARKRFKMTASVDGKPTYS